MAEDKNDKQPIETPEEKLYSIGEVSKICNVSKKALRFYDKIGLISPDYISKENNYRYYSRETLLFVPVIKYYKQMGFKLEEMKILMDSNRYDFHAKKMRDKGEELKKLREEINVAYTSVNDWYNLIREAEGVIENNVTEVSVKYIESITACYLEQPFMYNYMDAIINIEWTNYLEQIGHAITGPVHLYFPRFREKVAGRPTQTIIFQKGVGEVEEDLLFRTVINPKLRKLYKITIADVDSALKVIEVLHGRQFAEERKNMIKDKEFTLEDIDN